MKLGPYYKYFCLFTLVLISLTACKRQPMINISEENQARIEAKVSQEKNQSSVDTHSQADESQDNSPAEETTQTIGLEDLKQGWTKANLDTEFDFDLFAPYQANQIKTYSDGLNQETTYMTYQNEDKSLMQVEHLSSKHETELIQASQGQYQQIFISDQVNPYLSLLDQATPAGETDPITYLSAPLSQGNTWDYDGQGHQASISQLYQKANINGQVYDQVVEVKITMDNQIIYNYYGQDVGLLGQWSGQTEKESGQWKVLQSNAQDVMLVHDITWVSATEQDKLDHKSVSFSWQTNYQLAKAFEEILRQENILDTSITVNAVYVNASGQAVIDFSPGVVAVLNQNAASEKIVIQSIVDSLAYFFGVKEVRLTVNDNGLLPNSFDYPEGGIYQASQTED
ncbi:GerMN domain-containing protein [Eremococcus coleocola]|uniref:GerMN domain-containing protein n=1 Tax=Eremococcus coleocola ACS-139-V-Col8 TaxID=908337 RepID=E4KR56_9LACT|nr:GerMN domain-containing protein [Eremococcus coleocola]EFR30602.1 hypothetical protein HMPREF9257_0772 [Eremococcus coleocola ACS-139-V-Col8]